MMEALVNGLRTEATISGLRGLCPQCSGPVTAAVGMFKCKHWRHLNGSDCDSWSEGETPWHIEWKSHFPNQREITLFDEITNEKHRADVRAKNGVIVEFQNSYITPEEVLKRNLFYKNIVWVVNGCRMDQNTGNANENLKTTFKMYLKELGDKPNYGTFQLYTRSKLFHQWIDVNVPVLIDFGDPYIYLLKEFDKNTDKGVIKFYSKEDFINRVKL